MNSSAFESRSLSRGGDGSIGLNSGLNSDTCNSMSSESAGIRRQLSAHLTFLSSQLRYVTKKLVHMSIAATDNRRDPPRPGKVQCPQLRRYRGAPAPACERRSPFVSDPRAVQSTMRFPLSLMNFRRPALIQPQTRGQSQSFDFSHHERFRHRDHLQRDSSGLAQRSDELVLSYNDHRVFEQRQQCARAPTRPRGL